MCFLIGVSVFSVLILLVKFQFSLLFVCFVKVSPYERFYLMGLMEGTVPFMEAVPLTELFSYSLPRYPINVMGNMHAYC